MEDAEEGKEVGVGEGSAVLDEQYLEYLEGVLVPDELEDVPVVEDQPTYLHVVVGVLVVQVEIGYHRVALRRVDGAVIDEDDEARQVLQQLRVDLNPDPRQPQAELQDLVYLEVLQGVDQVL